MVTAADSPACGVRARLLATIPWNAPQGLPARVIANDKSTGRARRRYAPVRIRALPDGAVQLSASGEDRHVLMALEHGRVASHATLPAGPSRLLDALLIGAGDALLLLDDGGRRTVRRVDAAGGTVWERPAHADRILAAPRGASYLAEPGTAPRVAWLDEHGQPGGAPIKLTEPAGEILADPVGRLVAFRHDPTRGLRLWTVVDPSTGERHGTYGKPQAWPLLGAPIGVDGVGRVYGYAALELGRIALGGHSDWRVTLNNVVLADDGRITVATRPGTHQLSLNAGGSTAVELHDDDGAGRLVDRYRDGTVVLHHRGDDRLRLVSSVGQPAGEAAAGDDVWLRHCDLQPPTRGSVTANGEVLVGVRRPTDLAVLALRSPSA